MTSISPPLGVPVQAFSYDDFQGLDTSRDGVSLDPGQQQPLLRINNGFPNYRGIILRDRPVSFRSSSPGDLLISHVAFFGRDLVAWAQRDAGGTTLKAEPNGATAQDIYGKNATVSSTVFNSKLAFFSRGTPIYFYDGQKFERSNNEREQPSFGVSVQRRLAIAGGIGRPTTIDFSRVDDPTVFSRDEESTSTSVDKAADIDIKNVIGTSDEITGLGVFEKTKIACFTNDQALVYSTPSDYTRWQIVNEAPINVGCISHNSIASANTDLLFASRSGVHSLRRSEANGITIYSIPLSAKVEELYKSLYRSVANKEDIQAYYDQEWGQYNLFFPRTDLVTTRLTLSISPSPDGQNKWSTGDFLGQRCGATLGGVTVIGTAGGIYNIKDYEETGADLSYPEMVIETPILWHGSLIDTKKTQKFIIQASGQGRLIIDAFNEEGRHLQTLPIDLEPTDNEDDDYALLPLSRQYDRVFSHQYKGVRFRIRTEGGKGRVKIIGIAVLVEGPRKRRQE